MGTHTGPTSYWVEQVEDALADTYWINITLG